MKITNLFDEKFSTVTKEARWRKFNATKDKSHTPILIVEGMLKWGADAHNWAGPFKNSTCYVMILDCSKLKNLQTKEQHILDVINYTKYNLYSFPYSVRSRLLEIFPEHSKDINTDLCHFNTTYKGTPCSRSTLTDKELYRIRENCSVKEINEYEIAIVKHCARYKINVPTKETPIILYLAGNDDNSWSLFYTTVSTAINVFNILKRTPNFFTLDRLGAIFTN